MAVLDVLVGKARGKLQRLVAEPYVVELLVPALQPFQYFHGFRNGGFGDVDLLKPARQSAVPFEVPPVFVVRGRPDAPQPSGGKRRLEKVRCFDGSAAARGPRSDDCVNFINEQDDVVLLLQGLDDRLHPLLKVTPVARAGEHGAHVQRVDPVASQDVGNVAGRDSLRQSLRDGGLAHPGLTQVHGIVLQSAAENLDCALQDVLTADERLQFPLPREGGQLGCELLQRVGLPAPPARPLTLLLSGHRFGLLTRFLRSTERIRIVLPPEPGDAVRNHLQEIEPPDAGLLQEVRAKALLFVKNAHQQIPGIHLLLGGALRVKDRPLCNIAKPERLRGLAAFDGGHVVLQVRVNLAADQVRVRPALRDDFPGVLVVKCRVEHVFRREIFMPSPSGFLVCRVQDVLDVLGEIHMSSDAAFAAIWQSRS